MDGRGVGGEGESANLPAPVGREGGVGDEGAGKFNVHPSSEALAIARYSKPEKALEQ